MSKYSNRIDNSTPLSYSSVMGLINEIKEQSQKPQSAQPRSVGIPWPYDIYQHAKPYAEASGEPLDYIQGCIINGIYRKADFGFVCNIQSYRIFEAEMRLAYG